MPTMTTCCALVFAVIAMTPSTLRSEAPSAHERRVVAYFAGWTTMRVADIPADSLSHVIYAFAQIIDGRCALRDAAMALEEPYPDDPPGVTYSGKFRQLQVLKRKHPHLRTLVSVGGWNDSPPFSDAALTDASRQKFARSCAEFVNRYGFDGIDIDWEYPAGGGRDPDKSRPEDTRNFTLLLKELRRQLDEQGDIDQKKYLLTIATPAGPGQYRLIELDQVHPYVDWINLMTYDLAGNWSRQTTFNAPLYAPTDDMPTTQPANRLSVDDAVRAYLAAGVPPEKLVVGVPFYGHAFGGVPDVNHGLFQRHDHKSPRPANDSDGWSYRALAAKYIDKSARRFWNDDAKVPWLYDAAAGIMITYDDPESLRLKAEYVRAHGLGGVMIWELSHDDQQHSLLNALRVGLREP